MPVCIFLLVINTDLLSIINAPILSNTSEYRDNSYTIKPRFFGLYFCRRQYESVFNHFDVISPKVTKFGRITTNNGHYAVQGHRFSYQSKAHISCDFLLLINTNLHPLSHRSQVIADYWSNLLTRHGGTSL